MANLSGLARENLARLPQPAAPGANAAVARAEAANAIAGRVS
jgi:hypothetical protein